MVCLFDQGHQIDIAIKRDDEHLLIRILRLVGMFLGLRSALAGT